TPCSAPLLGGVLAWLVTQNVNYYIFIMIMVACGMSLPYFLFILFPQIIYKLPKPGRWNVILSQLVGLFLIGTTIYLLSLLPIAWLIPSLITLFILTFVLWIWGVFAKYAKSRVMLYLMRGVTLCIASILLYFLFLPSSTQEVWIPFDEQEFTTRLGKDVIVMNFTADWCPNCKILEQTVLTHTNLQKWKKEYNAMFILADITRTSPFLEKLMQLLHSNSIPLLVIFPTGEAMKRPLVLRDLYTKQDVEYALQRVRRNP
ncbi:MAG: thioredoxin family protein, partial [Desulfovibrionaceae bacterium]|nr:thioredoxin family protein [Desulfovibrionaceae bacterium]